MTHSLPPDPLEQLLSAMQSAAGPAPSVKEQQAVTAIVGAIHESPLPVSAHRISRVLTQLPSVRSAKGAVAAATLAVLLTGGTAAAATGSLPAPAQSAVAGALDHVGISVPGPNSHANQRAKDNAKNKAERKAQSKAENKAKNKGHGVPNAHAPKAHRDATDGGDASHATKTGQGPDATGAAKYGLCTAWAATPTPSAHSHKRDSVAFTNLQKAAAAAGKSVDDYCKGVTPPAAADQNGDAKDDSKADSSDPTGS